MLWCNKEELHDIFSSRYIPQIKEINRVISVHRFKILHWGQTCSKFFLSVALPLEIIDYATEVLVKVLSQVCDLFISPNMMIYTFCKLTIQKWNTYRKQALNYGNSQNNCIRPTSSRNSGFQQQYVIIE